MKTELSPGPSPEEAFLADALLWRPPLPVGRPFIGQYFPRGAQVEPNEAGYFWERLPRWMAETEEPFDAVKGSIATLDICSSVPFYAQLLRSAQFDRSGRRARELEAGLHTKESFDRFAANDRAMARMATALGKSAHARNLVVSTVQETLYQLTTDDVDEDKMAGFQAFLAKKLAGQDTIYRAEKGKDIESGWGYKIRPVGGALNYKQHLTLLGIPTDEALSARQRLAGGSQVELDRELSRLQRAAGDGLALGFLRLQAEMLAKQIVQSNRFRPARFFSMDIAQPAEIAVSSRSNTPAATQEMNLYAHAIESLFDDNRHIVGDILQPLPFPDNKLALITCFDGWPFNFTPASSTRNGLNHHAEVAVDRLMHFYSKLAIGGKLVIFPWAIANGGQAEQSAMTKAVGMFARQVGHGVDRRLYARETLMGWMSPSDEQTLDESSTIFRSDDETYEALIVTKPRWFSYRNLGQTATTAG